MSFYAPVAIRCRRHRCRRCLFRRACSYHYALHFVVGRMLLCRLLFVYLHLGSLLVMRCLVPPNTHHSLRSFRRIRVATIYPYACCCRHSASANIAFLVSTLPAVDVSFSVSVAGYSVAVKAIVKSFPLVSVVAPSDMRA